MLIDTHCHLNFKVFDTDLDNVVRRSVESGVERIIIPGTDMDSSKKAVEIAQQFPTCFAAVGIHPHHARDKDLIVNDDLQTQLTRLMDKDKVVAVGEVGMDYYYYRKTKYKDMSVTDKLKEKQKKLFELQLHLAQELHLPIIIHCREAFPDLLEIIDNFIATSGWKPHGVFHCFGGGKKHARHVLDMGFYIGFDGNLTYDQNLPYIASEVPIEKILVETDSPFLTPIPFRGQRNEPKNLPIVVAEIAKLKGIDQKVVVQQTTQNARNLFSLPS